MELTQKQRLDLIYIALLYEVKELGEAGLTEEAKHLTEAANTVGDLNDQMESSK